MLTESDDIISKSFLLFYPTAETFCWLLRQIQCHVIPTCMFIYRLKVEASVNRFLFWLLQVASLVHFSNQVHHNISLVIVSCWTFRVWLQIYPYNIRIQMHNVREKSQISCNTSLVFHTSQIITFRNLYPSYWAWAPLGIFWQSFICRLSGQPEYPATSPHTLDEWCSRSTPHSCALLVCRCQLACDQCVASRASPLSCASCLLRLHACTTNVLV